MHFKFIFALLFSVSVFSSNAQLIINEFETTGLERIELKNISNLTVDVNSFILCSYPDYNLISDISIVSGNNMMSPGDIVVVNGHPLGDTDGELALYLNFNFTVPNAIIDYVEWGSSFHVRSTIAQQAGIWTQGDFVPSPPTGVSLEFDGLGNSSGNWHVQQTPTFGLENGILSIDDELLGKSVKVHVSLNNQVQIFSANSEYPIGLIYLISADGRIALLEEREEEYEISISAGHLQAGIYVIRLYSGDRFTTKKIIIS
ncbi:MAG: T9SS type A sorting domain-containing protein [Bacteroidia bacterium]|nr:T9SS type A sorting domain-containing protein [Bacteroidia bacterium]